MVEGAAIDIGPDLDRPHAKITDYVLEFRDCEVRMLHRQRPHGFEPVGHDARRLRRDQRTASLRASSSPARSVQVDITCRAMPCFFSIGKRKLRSDKSGNTGRSGAVSAITSLWLPVASSCSLTPYRAPFRAASPINSGET